MRILADLRVSAESCRRASKLLGTAKDGDLEDHLAAFEVMTDVRSEVRDTIIPQLRAIVDRLSDLKAAEHLGTLKALIGDTEGEEEEEEEEEEDEDDDEYDMMRGALLLDGWSRRFSESCRHLMWFLAHLEPHASRSTQNTVIESATIGALSIGTSAKARGSAKPSKL